MEKNLKRVIVPTDPRGLDLVFSEMQDVLTEGLPWLNHAFGKSQKLKDYKFSPTSTTQSASAKKMRQNDDKIQAYPAAYIGSNEYLALYPNDKLKTFSFFVVHDPVRTTRTNVSSVTVEADVSLVFWFDLSSIYPGTDQRNTEAVKDEILNVLNSAGFPITKLRFSTSEIYEEADNVFAGYNLQEVDSQFLMQPYSGLRFKGKLIYREQC